MRNTLQEQYNLIKEGKGNKEHFFKSARHIFPDLITPVNSFSDAVTILKNRGIISEQIGGLVTTGKKQDWHAIFNENMDKLKEKKEENEDEELARRGDEEAQGKEDAHALPNIGKLKEGKKEIISQLMGPDFFLSKKEESTWDKADMDTYNKITNMASSIGKVPKLNESKEAKEKRKLSLKQIGKEDKKGLSLYKNTEDPNDLYYYDGKVLYSVVDGDRKGPSVRMSLFDITGLNEVNLTEAKEIKEPSKEVLDNQKHNFDYKDEKNYDNVFGQEFLQGYYTEMKDPKNADKHVDELRAIVAKNLAKDINHYVKDGQFGVKGLGYTTEAPGLGEPKEAKGPFKSSGYGDLKESVLRLAIQDIIKEVLAEADDKMPPLRRGDKGMFDGEEVEILAVPMHAKKDPKEPQPFSYTIKTKAGKKYEDVPISSVKPLNEALDKGAIKTEGEDAKKKAMKRRITNEIVKRKKKMKALQTLTELDGEGNEENAKKLKELQSEIKQLEGMMGKLDGKKKKNKEVEEALYDDPTSSTDKPIVATSPQSKAALTKAGMKEIPGTKDAK
jgi:hypothetical protein